MSKLENNLRRIEIIQMLSDAGMCEEYHGIINDCPMYAVDCPQTCTYARKIKEKSKNESEK